MQRLAAHFLDAVLQFVDANLAADALQVARIDVGHDASVKGREQAAELYGDAFEFAEGNDG